MCMPYTIIWINKPIHKRECLILKEFQWFFFFFEISGNNEVGIDCVTYHVSILLCQLFIGDVFIHLLGTVIQVEWNEFLVYLSLVYRYQMTPFERTKKCYSSLFGEVRSMETKTERRNFCLYPLLESCGHYVSDVDWDTTLSDRWRTRFRPENYT